MLAAGMGVAVADVVVNGAEFVRNGGNAVLTQDSERILGRPPLPFRAWATEHRDTFR